MPSLLAHPGRVLWLGWRFCTRSNLGMVAAHSAISRALVGFVHYPNFEFLLIESECCFLPWLEAWEEL